MDAAESDDSERWEDFFGSTTELAPSLLSLYDSLTQALDENLNSLKVSGNYVNNFDVLNTNTINEYTPVYGNSNIVLNSKPNAVSHYLEKTTIKNNCKVREAQVTSNNKPRIGLSPNVRSIIAHSQEDSVKTLDIDSWKQSPLASPVLKRNTRKPVPVGAHKFKFSHIPLSKITGQITQSNNDLVDTFRAKTYCSLNSPKDFSTSSKNMAADVDEQKTPTNCDNHSFVYDSYPWQTRLRTEHDKANNRLIDIEKQQTASLPLSPISEPNVIPYDAVNYELLKTTSEMSTSIENESKSSITSSEELIEAINMPVVSKSLGRSLSDAGASVPLSTYARLKNMSTKATTLPAPGSIKLPTPQQLEQLAAAQEASELSAESLDRLTDIKPKFSPKESRKFGSIILPEIAKLKHRPLSSSSICSTSSSSSSGSDQLNGKLTTSYLASVESLADQSENELTESHHSMTVFERACLEIVESERSYVGDLGQVIRGYLRDWRERACLNYDQLSILFSNIEDIYAFNSALLKRLNESGMDTVRIAKCFIEMQDGFDVYTKYCTSYPDAISLLTKLLQATHTNALLTSTQKHLQHNLPLGSYLLKPVQRILKYHLLLDNLCKHCDVKEVHQAYEIMRQVARHIDQVKRKLEQQSRVKELSGILDGWMGPELTVLGELRLEGILLEHNKPRRVFLFATMLIITKPKEDNRLQFKSYIHQNNLMLREHLRGEPTSFCVIPYDDPRNQIKLTCRNRDQKRLWAQNIKGVILEKFDNIPNRAKELVYKLGDEEDRQPDKNTWKWGLHSTPTPVYLERRNQCRRSEMRNRNKYKRKTLPTKTELPTSLNEMCEQLAEATVSHNVNFSNNLHKMSNENGACNMKKQNVCDEVDLVVGRLLKERSKSVPKIDCVQLLEEPKESQTSTNLDVRKSKSSKTLLPKRIATIRKSRFLKKETSKFYMDLHGNSDTQETATELKITESIENMLDNKVEDVKEQEKLIENVQNNNLDTVSMKQCKDDLEIIMDLLKHNKDFERFYKKQQKKRVQDINFSTSVNNELINVAEPPPRPPSKSPPPLETDEVLACQMADAHDDEDEPLYETLRRNVHVPYKFSPVFVRSKSLQYCKRRENKSEAPSPPRPESDYVTLVYSPDGFLKNVQEEKNVNCENNLGSTYASSSTLKCESVNEQDYDIPVSINAHAADTEAIYAIPTTCSITSQSQSNKSALNSYVSKSEIALPNASTYQRKPPERRASDVGRMFFQSVLHRQGSEAVGERMAHTDYADPRQLLFGFTSHHITNSQCSLQRDSFFSLTSSSDSMCATSLEQQPSSLCFDYEQNVEACLEREFRDSAIYSDDNEKRLEYDTNRNKSHLSSSFAADSDYVSDRQTTTSKSWVLQQIENFSK